MGYDCTLHVIDEKMIKERFVPRLLDRSSDRCRLDDREDSEEIWSEVKAAIPNPSKHDAGSYVCQLAIAYCSEEGLPFTYERGFCLSLWGDQPDYLIAKVPKKLIGDPSVLFEEVTAAYPHLKGRYPNQIESNFCPGIYIPSDHVPALLEWVEKKVKRYPKPDRRQFHGLILMLKYAAQHGLAYWEGTDLPVSMDSVQPMQRTGDADEYSFKDWFLSPVRQLGDTVVCKQGPGEHQLTCIFDFAQWPPSVTTTTAYTIDVARSAKGRLLEISRVNDEVSYRARVRNQSWDEAPKVFRTHSSVGPGGLSNGGFVGEKVIVFPFGCDRPSPKAIPLIETEVFWETLTRDYSPPSAGSEEDPFRRRYTPGVVPLNDGSSVIIMFDKGYEVIDGEVTLTFPELAHVYSTIIAVPWGTDGFIYIGDPDDRQSLLYLAKRGESPHHQLLPPVGVMVQIAPGPAGAILISLGVNKKGSIGLLYFVDEDEYIRIEPELFPDEDPREIHALYWFDGIQKLVAKTFKRFWAYPAEKILSLPRYNAQTGRKKKG